MTLPDMFWRTWGASDFGSVSGRGEMRTWREVYSAAVLETDPNRLDQLIEETTNAMLQREKGLESNPDAERQEMARASEALLVLKNDQQSWREYKAIS